MNCSSLMSITIPNSVTSIGCYAFWGCSSLTDIIIPNSVTSIEDDAFADCSSLTDITLPNSVTSIGGGAFAECSSLTSITMPNTVTSIGNGAFYHCSSLKNIAIEIVDWEKRNYFANYVAKSSILPESTFHYSYNGKKLEGEIEIPTSVAGIGNYALYKCEDVIGIVIPNSVTSIGKQAFTGSI